MSSSWNMQRHRAIAVLVALAAVAGWRVPSGNAQEANPLRPRPVIDGEDLGSRGQPLRQIGSLMADVKLRLDSRDTSAETQAIQQNIVEGLGSLIDAQMQSSSQQRGASGQQEQPRDAVGDRPDGTDGRGLPPEPVGALGNSQRLLQQIWGHLPDQVRQQIETPLHEKFLPQYDDLIQEYFKRLADEKPK